MQKVSSMSTNTGRAPRWMSGSMVGKRRVAGHDDFVAGPDALELVQQIDNHRPGRAEDALRGAGVRGEFGFKGLAFLAEDVLAGADGAQRGFLDFRRSRNIWITGFCS